MFNANLLQNILNQSYDLLNILLVNMQTRGDVLLVLHFFLNEDIMTFD